MAVVHTKMLSAVLELSTAAPVIIPICDVEEGLCLKSSGDYLGIAAKKKKMAKHKLPWTKYEEAEKRKIYEPLQWKRNQFAAMR
ncbi:hypothetical protein Patl1_10504 [Pistacia atlantica]|uniref:Uncharacterized protein n=1 Tax=Pistacia atlantica TaxID=434234 RepID=A0ACC1A933_9ROSI|nr:hypothetical protein Patl1_10504 [Pistacia atlantica]